MRGICATIVQVRRAERSWQTLSAEAAAAALMASGDGDVPENRVRVPSAIKRQAKKAGGLEEGARCSRVSVSTCTQKVGRAQRVPPLAASPAFRPPPLIPCRWHTRGPLLQLPTRERRINIVGCSEGVRRQRQHGRAACLRHRRRAVVVHPPRRPPPCCVDEWARGLLAAVGWHRATGRPPTTSPSAPAPPAR